MEEATNEYQYMVATRCFTYNQAPYIKDALRGFALQETTFPAVYIVVDDASNDGEQGILREWVSQNLMTKEGGIVWQELPYGSLIVAPLKCKPNSTFVILLLSENHYQTGKNTKRIDYISKWYDNAKYHALCEGDDYWIDSMKLQKQVSFLESHSDYVLTYTDSIVINQNSRKVFHRNPNRFSGNITKELVGRGNFIDTATVCYINKDKEWQTVRASIPFKLLMGDKPMWIFYSSLGKIQFFKDKTTVYRLLPESASHTKDITKSMAFIDNTAEITRYFNRRYNVGIDESILEKQFRIAKVRESAKISRSDFLVLWKKLILDYPKTILNIRLDIIAVVRIILNRAV